MYIIKVRSYRVVRPWSVAVHLEQSDRVCGVSFGQELQYLVVSYSVASRSKEDPREWDQNVADDVANELQPTTAYQPG